MGPLLGVALRGGRVLGLGLRLLGRHRAALVVAFVVALGWFVTSARAVAAGPDDRTVPNTTALDGLVAVAGDGALWGLAFCLVVAAVCYSGSGLLALGGWLLRHRRDAVRGQDGG